MKKLLALTFVACTLAAPAAAQWQTKAHSVPVGKGGGNTGFSAVGPCNSGIPYVGAGGSLDPTCGPLALGASGAVSGNLPVANLNGGTGASATTYWSGAGAWTTPPGSFVSTPQGYLNLLGLAAGNGDVVQTGDITSATVVYYSPFVGSQIPIYNGTSFQQFVFPELTASLTASGSPSFTIQDLCVFSNSGTPTLVIGPSWSSVGVGTGSRGTGGGTAQLTRINGIWVNAVQISAYNGLSNYTVPANQCTYVGSMYVDGSGGQVSAHRTYGQFRKWGIWNAYNRQLIVMLAGDNTSSWTYGTATPRPSNNNGANFITTFVGLPEEPVTVDFFQNTAGTSGVNTGMAWLIGIGWDSNTAFSGTVSSLGVAAGSASNSISTSFGAPAVYVAPPAIGINSAQSLEEVTSASAGSVTFKGTASNMLLRTQYRG